MGAVFAFATAASGRTADVSMASPEAVATGLRITFAVAAMLVALALVMAATTYRRWVRDRAAAPDA
jgi:hypothetical protein